jgi:hypothetical protein
MTTRSLSDWLGGRETFEAPCTVEVEHTADSLHAYVELDGDIDIGPGDEVIVHGDPIQPAFGEKIVERRQATVRRANWFGRLTARIKGAVELTELYEVSFTPRRKL